MTKRLLCVLLSVAMLFGCFAIVGQAEYEDAEFEEVLQEILDEEGLDLTDAKKALDCKFFHAYEPITENTWGTTFIPENVTLNLQYWKPEISEEYYACQTNDDYEALFRKMMTPYHDDITWMGEWYKYRDESVTELTLRYVIDKEEVHPGDTINVNVYATTNYWTQELCVGYFYDKSLLTGVSATTPISGLGYFEYWFDYGITESGYDEREDRWPLSMRNPESYAKYKGVKTGASPDPVIPPYQAVMFNDDLFTTFTMKVKDDAPIGSEIELYIPDDAIVDEYYADEYFSGNNAIITHIRAASQNDPMRIDSQTVCGTKVNIINNDKITVVGDVADTADYADLDAAVADKDALTETEYTENSWAAYNEAVEAAKAVTRDLSATDENQATIDAATKAVTDAKAALVKLGIVSATVIGTPIINANANVNVTVTGSPDEIKFIKDGNSYTFDRDSATITTSGDNEVWSVKLLADSATATYDVYPSYNGNYLEEGKSVVINAKQGMDLSIHSLSIPGMVDGTTVDSIEGNGNIAFGYNNVIVTTSTDVSKIQFVDAKGNTWTYSTATSGVKHVDKDGERTWTISHKFMPYGTWSMNIRTRATTTTFATANGKLEATVLAK